MCVCFLYLFPLNLYLHCLQSNFQENGITFGKDHNQNTCHHKTLKDKFKDNTAEIICINSLLSALKIYEYKESVKNYLKPTILVLK